MQYTLNEAVEKLEQIHGVIKTIDDGRSLGSIDREIIRDLLDDYLEILSNIMIKI